eukprot:gene17239-biopygen4674
MHAIEGIVPGCRSMKGIKASFGMDSTRLGPQNIGITSHSSLPSGEVQERPRRGSLPHPRRLGIRPASAPALRPPCPHRPREGGRAQEDAPVFFFSNATGPKLKRGHLPARWSDKSANATPAHLFAMGSVQKMYTASAVMLLAEKGAVGLNDTI